MTRYDIQHATDKAAQWLDLRVWRPIRPLLIGAGYTWLVFGAGLVMGLGARDTVPTSLARDAIRLAYKTGIDTAVLSALDSSYDKRNPYPLPFPQCNTNAIKKGR